MNLLEAIRTLLDCHVETQREIIICKAGATVIDVTDSQYKVYGVKNVHTDIEYEQAWRMVHNCFKE